MKIPNRERKKEDKLYTFSSCGTALLESTLNTRNKTFLPTSYSNYVEKDKKNSSKVDN